MKAKKKYRIAIEDESRLRQVASVSVSPAMLWTFIIAGILVLIVFTGMLIMATPVRTLMPGYLKNGERAEAKQSLLRIDSIRDAYRINSLYLSNILTVLDTDRTPTDSLLNVTTPNELPPDSLMPSSPREIEFITQMKDREQYNVNILAPIAADQLRIYPVAPEATVAEQSTNTMKPKILTPKGSPICSAADGRVIAIQNPAPEGGSAIVIQHDNGFVTRYSHLGTPSIAPGAHVDGGSVIAHGATGGAIGSGFFFVEIWYDGNAVEPAKILGI